MNYAGRQAGGHAAGWGNSREGVYSKSRRYTLSRFKSISSSQVIPFIIPTVQNNFQLSISLNCRHQSIQTSMPQEDTRHGVFPSILHY